MSTDVYLATTAQVTTEASNQDGATLDTTNALRAIAAVSVRVMEDKECPFEPNIETRTFDARMGGHMTNDARTLWLHYPLLSITSVTLGDGTAVTADKYTLEYGQDTPYFGIRLKQSSGYRWTQYSGDYEDAIEIEGVWGYRKQYSRAWVSGSTLNGNITDSATSVTVTSGTPFSPGMLLKIENEWLRLTAVSTNTLTVERGVNGSTAAAHVTTTAVSIWTVEPLANRAVVKWAGLLLSRRGSFEQTQYDGLTTVTYPQDMPGEVKAILDSFYNAQGFAGTG